MRKAGQYTLYLGLLGLLLGGLLLGAARLGGQSAQESHSTTHPGDASGEGAVATSAAVSSPSTCASCHPSQARTQPFTPMGQALVLPATNPNLKAHPLMTFQRGAYTYTVKTAGESSTYNVTDGAQTISLPIHWSLGIGAQTWVLEKGGKFYESLVSYYPAIAGLDVTTGDEGVKPTTIEQAMGRVLLGDDVKTCFGCHATNVVTNGKVALEKLQPGITCEHCHEGATLHAADANQGAFDTAPPRLRELSSEATSNFCGQCHRTWETVVRSRWLGSSNVRFQAYRLANSRCFDGTDPRISCVACHNPHQDVVREAVSYDGKCLACHAAPLVAGSSTPPPPVAAKVSLKPASEGREQARACPVAKSNCVSCHMPKTVFPGGGGHLSFTDHQIRVVKPGEAYPN